MSENVSSLENAEWQAVEPVGSSSSDDEEEDMSPYHGYVTLETGADEDLGPGQGEEGDDEVLRQVDMASGMPEIPLSSKFMPRGTPVSVLAQEVPDDGSEIGLPPSSNWVDKVDFEQVRKVASKIQLKALQSK